MELAEDWNKSENILSLGFTMFYYGYCYYCCYCTYYYWNCYYPLPTGFCTPWLPVPIIFCIMSIICCIYCISIIYYCYCPYVSYAFF